LCGHPARVWNGSGAKETSHAALSHSCRRLGASARLGRKRIGTKLPSSLGVPGLATVAESLEPKATDASRTQNVKNNLPSRKGLPRTVRRDLRRFAAAGSHQRLAMRHLSQRDNDEYEKEPLLKELRRQENQSTPPADQAARDALFDEFL